MVRHAAAYSRTNRGEVVVAVSFEHSDHERCEIIAGRKCQRIVAGESPGAAVLQENDSGAGCDRNIENAGEDRSCPVAMACPLTVELGTASGIKSGSGLPPPQFVQKLPLGLPWKSRLIQTGIRILLNGKVEITAAAELARDHPDGDGARYSQCRPRGPSEKVCPARARAARKRTPGSAGCTA